VYHSYAQRLLGRAFAVKKMEEMEKRLKGQRKSYRRWRKAIGDGKIVTGDRIRAAGF